MQFMTGKSVENLPRYMEQDRRDSEYQAKKEQRKAELEHAERIREVGKLLLSWDDYTPTGLMEFSKKYNVAQTELQEAAPMIKDFRTKYDQTVTNQSPDGIKRTSAWSSENPTAPRVDLGVSEVPKLDELVGTNSEGAPTVSGWNPYNASKQGSEIVNGQTDDQRLQNDLKRERVLGPAKNENEIAKQRAIGPIKNEQEIAKQAAINRINPKKPGNVVELTREALTGDTEAKQILNKMAEDKATASFNSSKESTKGKLEGLQEIMDVNGTANAVLEGRETIENVKNTFGVPIQEAVRKAVLDKDKSFNFVQPRANVKALSSSLQRQQKARGMMGSFVTNINEQVDKIEKISEDIVNRAGIRALDYPIREFNTRFIGSGNENVFAGYMKEVSAEIAKLAQGSAESVAQLPEENRKEWERIHDVNLSLGELLKVLNGTRQMANIRLKSVDEELAHTIDQLGNVTTKTEEDPLGIR